MASRSARVGETIKVSTMGTLATIEVEKPCTGGAGTHYCATHRKWLANNMQANTHYERGTHVEVWDCFEHGPEAVR
jgi:hypothetical protein